MFDNPELNKEYVRWRRWDALSFSYEYSFDSFLTSDEYRKHIGTTTICSCDKEAELENSEVPLQRAFTGPPYVLPAEVADTSLSLLSDEESILNRMNTILRTNRTLTSGMNGLLRFCLNNFEDFGQAYACLRPRWHMDPSDARKNILERFKQVLKSQSRALENDIVVRPYCPPRRLWDLPSNRVMPFWALQVEPFDDDHGWKWRTWLAVSHSWMEENRRHKISSPINGHEWPIPIPIDTSLEHIRIELLNLAAEVAGTYSVVWLDVVCLRQEGVVANESLRKDEWKLDVPTIGPIYKDAECVVYYFSGLGRPFKTPTDKNDPRHWMNRAWTLQETQNKILVAGRSPSSPKIPYSADFRNKNDSSEWKRCIEVGDDAMKALMAPFTKVDDFSIIVALLLMRHRSATSELDKIAGLTYSLNGFKPPLPAYIVGEDTEDAWARLIKATNPIYHSVILFLFPKPGTGKHIWYPSWRQISDKEALEVLPMGERVFASRVVFDERSDTWRITGYLLEHCWVEGLDVGSHDNPAIRSGKVRVVDKEGKEHIILIVAENKTSIPDGYYVLVGAVSFLKPCISPYWMVARKTEQGFVEKVSVIRSEGYAIDELAERFGFTTSRLL